MWKSRWLIAAVAGVVVAIGAAAFLTMRADESDHDCIHVQAHGSSAHKVRYLGDGNAIITGGNDGRIATWNARTGALIGDVATQAKLISSLDTATNGNQVAAGVLFSNGDTYVRYGQMLDEKCRITEDVAYPLCASPDGRVLAISTGTAVRIWDTAQDREVRRFGAAEHLYTCMRFTPDGSHVVTGGRDDMIRVWDVSTGVATFRYGPSVGNPWSIAVSPDSKVIFSGHDDGQVLAWSLVTGQSLGAFRADSFVTGLDCSPDGKRLASCGYDGMIRLWDAQTHRQLGSRRISGGTTKGKRKLFGVAFAPDGGGAAVVDEEGQLVIWPFGAETTRSVTGSYGSTRPMGGAR